MVHIYGIGALIILITKRCLLSLYQNNVFFFPLKFRTELSIDQIIILLLLPSEFFNIYIDFNKLSKFL